MRDAPDRVPKLIAYLMGGLVLLMAAMELGKAVREHMAAPVMPATDDRLRAELARCRTLTPDEIATDTACRAVWAENRQRFFGALAEAPEGVSHGRRRRHRPVPGGLRLLYQ